MNFCGGTVKSRYVNGLRPSLAASAAISATASRTPATGTSRRTAVKFDRKSVSFVRQGPDAGCPAAAISMPAHGQTAMLGHGCAPTSALATMPVHAPALTPLLRTLLPALPRAYRAAWSMAYYRPALWTKSLVIGNSRLPLKGKRKKRAMYQPACRTAAMQGRFSGRVGLPHAPSQSKPLSESAIL